MHVVFGGSGGLGAAVVRELIRQGKPARAVSRSGRSPEGAEGFAADGADPARSKEACEGAAVVFCCAGVPYTDGWEETWPPLLDGILEGAESAGARFVMGDNLYMYPPPKSGEKLHEGMPEQPTTRKGKVRAEMAATLRKAHGAGRVPVVIVRASDFYGPGVTNAALGDRIFGAAVRGATAGALGDIDQPHSYAYIDDVARAMVLLAARDEALGETYHAPHATAVTTREFVEKVYRTAGREPKIRALGSFGVGALAWLDPTMRQLKEMMYQWEQPFVVDDSKFREASGGEVEATPLEDGIAATLDWYRKREG